MLQSKVLQKLGKKHAVVNTPADGNCFYHAFSYIFDVPYESIRSDIANKVTEEDAYVFSAINGVKQSRQELSLRIEEGRDFADDVEISKAVQIYGVVLYIVDDEFESICVQCDEKQRERSKHGYMLRKGLHYSPILFKTRSGTWSRRSKDVQSIMKGKKCYSFSMTHAQDTIDHTASSFDSKFLPVLFLVIMAFIRVSFGAVLSL